MANRKGLFKTLGLVLSGFVIGAILVGGVLAYQYSKTFKNQYYSGILSIANTAYSIRAHRQDDLLKTIEANIRQCVLSADSLWGNDEDRLDTFWFVQRYYEKFDLSVPEDIKLVLDRLPPQPPRSCQVKPPEDESEKQAGPVAPGDLR